jgi:hypothetical protein
LLALDREELVKVEVRGGFGMAELWLEGVPAEEEEKRWACCFELLRLGVPRPEEEEVGI